MNPVAISDAERRAGFLAAAGSYAIWGFLPLFLKLFSFVDGLEVLAQRIVWCLPAAVVCVFAMSGWRRGLREIGAALRPRLLMLLTLSAAFILVNWGLYVYLVLHDRVIESALAYFLAPLVSVVIGVSFFGERIRSAQIAALALALIGVIVQGFAVGAPPWMALALCGTWSVYAVLRKQVAVPAATGLLLETTLLLPVALALFAYLSAQGPLAASQSWSNAILLALMGPFTALPLVLFAFGARRVSFTALGLLQFLAPTLQFITGIAFGEEFTWLRGVSFVLIWAGLAFFSWDVWRQARAVERAA